MIMKSETYGNGICDQRITRYLAVYGKLLVFFLP